VRGRARSPVLVWSAACSCLCVRECVSGATHAFEGFACFLTPSPCGEFVILPRMWGDFPRTKSRHSSTALFCLTQHSSKEQLSPTNTRSTSHSLVSEQSLNTLQRPILVRKQSSPRTIAQPTLAQRTHPRMSFPSLRLLVVFAAAWLILVGCDTAAAAGDADLLTIHVVPHTHDVGASSRVRSRVSCSSPFACSFVVPPSLLPVSSPRA
jgi:hypothetical protein